MYKHCLVKRLPVKMHFCLHTQTLKFSAPDIRYVGMDLLRWRTEPNIHGHALYRQHRWSRN